jgi:hypothetical protein
MWHALGRLILVPLGFVVAAMVSIFIVVTLGLERLTHASTAVPILEWAAGVMAAGITLTSGLTLIPALAVVTVGEVARIRSWLYYLAGGGLSLALLPLMGLLERGQAASLSDGALWQVLATAGFAGGLVYWLIAGRTA